MTKQLTKEQIDALNLDIHIALNANAGSGKTSVLVERYFKILERALELDSNLTPDKIVAITFTKKAAAEMLSRVISKFSEKYDIVRYSSNFNNLDLRFLDKIRTFRNKLTNARISTIHSFCLQIISNYPIEAGIPVYFREITESERLQLLEDSFNRTLMNWLENPDSKKQIGKILSVMNLKDLKSLVFKTISNYDLWNDLQCIYSKSFEEYFQTLKYFVSKTFNLPFSALMKGIALSFEDYEDLNLSRESKSLIARFCGEINSLEKDEFPALIFDEQFFDLFENLVEIVFTKKHEPRKKVFSKNQDIYIELLNLIKSFKPIFEFFLKFIEYYNIRRKLTNIFQDLDIERIYFETSKIIFSFIKDVFTFFEQTKYNEGLLDFTDMLIKARDLLKNFPEILSEVRNNISFLLIDEFQDTDKIQLEIVQLLVPDSYGVNSKNINLFIVGDEKQSIYSFRNADVRVFKEAKEHIIKLNSSCDSGAKGLLKLTTTFRLKPQIAGFVDKIFVSLMKTEAGDPISDFQVNYEPFVIPEEKLAISKRVVNSSIAPISFLLEVAAKDLKNKPKDLLLKDSNLDVNTNSQSEDKISTLPFLLSKHIKHIVNNPHIQIFDKDIDGFRNIKFSDIAVISRKTKDLAQLASVFADNSVPFIFFGSKNFFSTREIQDIISFLKFLVNPNDDVALCAILRSVFFGFTDEILVNIATISTSGDLSFWEKLLLYNNFIVEHGSEIFESEELEIQIKRLNQAINAIEKLKPQASILPVNELIHRILVETEWHKKIRVFQNYEQMLANVDELLDYTRDYISAGFRTILDLLDDIDFIARRGVTDVDRFGFVAADAVVLLTIHTAKGLEFPVVYFHNIDYGKKMTESIEVSRELGLVFPMEIAIGDEIYKFQTLQCTLAQQQLEIEIKAEETRILYVALTRASDYLFITGKIQEDKSSEEDDYLFKANNSLGEILDILSIYIRDVTSNLRIIQDVSIQIGRYAESSGYKIENTNISVPIDIIFDINSDFLEDNTIKISKQTKEGSKAIYLLDKLGSKISKNVFSSTKFNIYAYNPKDYLKSYFLGIHRDIHELYKSNLIDDFEYRDDIILGSIIGNTIHYCLEKINKWYDVEGFHIDRLVEIIETSLFEQKRNIERDVQNQIIQQCLNVVQTQLFNKYRQKILLAKKEFELLLPFFENYLIAKLDVLFENDLGESEIWDWKSNNVKTIDDLKRVAKSYEIQMKTYVFALSRLMTSQSRFKARLLFTRLARPNSNDDEWTYVFEWEKDEILNIEKELTSYITNINNLVI